MPDATPSLLPPVDCTPACGRNRAWRRAILLTAADQPRIRRAAQWLVTALANGPVPASVALQTAREAGHPRDAVMAAKSRLGVPSVRHAQGRSGRWEWLLPDRLTRP
jgi:CTP:molybdopterin cytidylyltransferase MocA